MTGRRGRCGWWSRIAVVGATVAVAPCCGPVPARAEPVSGLPRKPLPRDVPAGPLDMVLRRIAADSDEQILVDPVLLAGRRGGGVARGTALETALARVLAGSGLTVRRVGPGVLVVVAAGPARDEDDRAWPAEPDIVVTAQRRPTLLSEAGPDLAVVSGATLAQNRTVERRTLARLLPALTVTSTGPMQQRLSVRGVLGTGESTVGVYFGEVPVTAPSGTGFDPGAMSPDIDLIDVERVELLKGPQGTLYGASSMGGTLRTIFRQPDAGAWAAEVSAEAGIATGGAPGAALSAMVNAPLVDDRLALRVVAGRRRIGGAIDNARLGYRDGDTADRESARVALAWTPDDALRIDLSGLVQDNRLADAGVWILDDGRRRADLPVRTPSAERLRLVTGTARWAPGKLRVTATLSHYGWRTIRQIDFTNVLERQRGSDAACRRYAALTGSGGGCDDAVRAAYRTWLDTRLPAILYQPMQLRSTSGELRLSDDGNGAWRWTIGVFAEHRADRVDSNTVRADAASGTIVTPLDLTGRRLLDMRLDQQAVFAEASRALGAGFTATLGMRAYRYVREAGGSVPVPNIITGTGLVEEARYRTTATGRNAKAALDWRAADGTLVRLIASQGFRPGGVNITPELTPAERVFRADRLWNYELGVKLPLHGAAAGVEGSAFHIDWDDTIFVASSANGAFLYNTNLSSVDIDGVEARATANTGAWRFAVAGTWLSARLAADAVPGTMEGTGRRGDRLPQVPALSWVASADTRLRTGAQASVMLGALASGSSGFFSAFGADNPYRERTPGRMLVDLYALYRRGAWSARLGVDNVADASAPSRIFSSAFGERQVYAARPRTVTLTMGWGL
ncbi:TonB-dependent receptor [Sphingomonas adhaesiva]|uniref:TonB-dependent receptor n=1 Tax=Sphingomonas adhaesiva TaxID=28212 RepID=UPI002FFAEF66